MLTQLAAQLLAGTGQIRSVKLTYLPASIGSSDTQTAHPA